MSKSGSGILARSAATGALLGLLFGLMIGLIAYSHGGEPKNDPAGWVVLAFMLLAQLAIWTVGPAGSPFLYDAVGLLYAVVAGVLVGAAVGGVRHALR